MEHQQVASGSTAANSGISINSNSNSNSNSKGTPAAAQSNGQASEATKRKTSKKAVSCESCRRRKLKCDRGWPCGACRNRGEADKCTWQDGQRPTASGRDAVDSRPIMQRIDRLESMMVSIAAKLGIESPLNGESGQGATISGSDEPSNQTPAYSALAKGKARALNGDAVLRRGQTRSESRSGKVPFNPVAPIWLFAPPPSKEAQCQELCALLDMLPPTETVRAMCNFYFFEVSWTHYCIPEHVFRARLHEQEEVRLMWNGRPTIGSSEKLRELILFTGLVMAFCGLALLFSDDFEESVATNTNGRPSYGVLLDGAHRALIAANFVEEPTIDAVRVMIVVILALSAIRGPATGTYMLSACIHVAFAIDLDLDPPLSAPREEADDRLRLWAVLCIMDWLGAGSVKRTYIIRKEPQRLAELDMQSIAISEHPYDSQFLKLNLARIGRHLADRTYMSEEVAYATTLQLEQQLREYEHCLPAIYRKQSPDLSEDSKRPFLAWQRTSLHMAMDVLRISLHKRYYISGWLDPRYRSSRDACFEAACDVLHLFRTVFSWTLSIDSFDEARLDSLKIVLDSKQNVITRLWFFSHNAVTSALLLQTHVSMMDAHPEQVSSDPTLRTRVIDDLRVTKQLLSALSSRSKIAREGAEVLDPPEPGSTRNSNGACAGAGAGSSSLASAASTPASTSVPRYDVLPTRSLAQPMPPSASASASASRKRTANPSTLIFDTRAQTPRTETHLLDPSDPLWARPFLDGQETSFQPFLPMPADFTTTVLETLGNHAAVGVQPQPTIPGPAPVPNNPPPTWG